jgi:hypothetical protein
MSFPCRPVLALAFSLVLLPVAAFAQVDKGALLGTVVDSSQAVIPQTVIRVTEVNTGVSRSVMSNEGGNWTIPLLDPGTYRVEAEHQGFKKGIREGVPLTANSNVRVDFTLELGSVSESVDVTASDAPILQTDRADVSQKIESDLLQSLPLGNNRNYENAFVLVPGTTRPFIAHSPFYDSQESLSTQVNGQDRHWNNFLIEGINNNWDNGNLTILVPPADAIQTVDVSTSAYDAEFGRVGGAVANVIIKSGGNDFHGTLFEFDKNAALYSRNFFAPNVPPLIYNQFGGSLGGRIKRNKAFFFVDYQGSDDHESFAQNYTIPSTGYKNGDFSASPTLIYDPNTGAGNGIGRTPFPNRIIPSSRISPVAAAIMSGVPAPTYTGLSGNYAGVTAQVKTIHSFDVKVDQQWTSKDTLAIRYSYSIPDITYSPLYGSKLGGPGGTKAAGNGFAGTGTSRAQFPGLSYVHVFSPSLITQVRFGIARIRNDANNTDYGTTDAKNVGIPGANIDDWSSGMTEIDITGYDTPTIGYNSSLPWRRAQTDFGINNSWTKIHGNHTFKWGVDIDRERTDLRQTGAPRGVFTFNPGPAALNGDTPSTSGMANAFASFLLDVPNTLSRALSPFFPTRRQSWFFFYGTDKWQVSRKLTLDIGLRWEAWPTTHTAFRGQFVDYDPATNSLLVGGYGNTPANLGVSPDLRAWAPRLGIAYRLNDKTVIRTGFGTSYLWRTTGTANYPATIAPAYSAVNSYSAAGSMATGFPPPPFVPIPDNGIIPNAPVNLAYTVAEKNPHHQYLESYNFAVQRQLPSGFSLDVAYVGNHGVNQSKTQNINRGLVIGGGAAGQPFFQTLGKTAGITTPYAWVTSRYNSLQIKVNRRLVHGLTTTTAYTWSHGLDYNNDASTFNFYLFRSNYSSGDYDHRHSFVQSFTYLLPFGAKGAWLRTGVASWILGGWQTTGVFSAIAGQPIDVTISATALNTPTSSNRPNQVKDGVATLGGVGAGSLWFDTSAFAAPPALTFGNVGRNSIIGPGLVNLDASVFRRFQLRERTTLDFRFETFNTTNHPHFANPGGTFGTSTFGVVTQTVAYDYRAVQVGAKIIF